MTDQTLIGGTIMEHEEGLYYDETSVMSIKRSNEIIFDCNEIKISSRELCLGFEDAVLDLNRVDTLIFDFGFEKHRFKRVIDDENEH